MSIMNLAIRIAAVRALQAAQTIAGDRIFDSAIMPIDSLVSENPMPFVVITTEDELFKPSGRDFFGGNGEVDLLIETGLAKAAKVPGPGGEEIELSAFESDAALEVCIAILRRQIMGCLFGAGGGAWGDVFRAFVKDVTTASTTRAAQSKNGARFAGRKMLITISALAEPPFAPVGAGTPWEKFFSAAEADTGLGNLPAVIRQAIEGKPADWPEVYSVAGAAAGYTREEMQFLGVDPLHPATEAGDTETLTGATVEPDGWTLDGDAITGFLPPDNGA